VSDRRGFFRDLLREAAGVAQELSAAMQAATEPEQDDLLPPLPAKPATAAVNETTLLALCHEVGLAHREDDVRSYARESVRLTRGDATSRSRIGGVPDLPPGFVWPSWNGRELDFVAQVDLEAVAAVDPETILPRRGVLSFFSGVGEGRCVVRLVDGELEPVEGRGRVLPEYPLELSRELMLPAGWSFQAEELDLTPDERDAWDELRDRLALVQGVELEETSLRPSLLHRLLGYHEEIGREVEVDCALGAAGLDADDGDVYHEHRAALEADARRWRLLLQVSAEGSDGFERLYVCIHDDDLRAGRFDGAWAVSQ
jgi:Domain of unknown function (DUF1963)